MSHFRQFLAFFCDYDTVIEFLLSLNHYKCTWMSTDGQSIKWRRNIAENFNRLSRVHERYRRQTDGRAIAYSEREREFTFAKKQRGTSL